jgi:hypothetical protein
MDRTVASVAFLLLFGGVACAQTPPTDAPEPAAPPADPAQPPPEQAAPAEPAPVVEAPPPELKPEGPKKDEKPAVTAKYDGGLKFSTADDQYELKLSFRNQVRFESNRSLDEETPARHNQFLNTFYIPRSRLQAEGHLFGDDNRFKVELGMGDTGSFSFVKDMYLEKRVGTSPAYLRVGQWKRPFNRAEIVSDFASTFNERWIENELAGGGRSLGIAIHNEYEKSPEGLEWVIGMFDTFNGGSDRPVITTACVDNPATMAITCVNSRPTTFSADFGPTLVARIGFNSKNAKGYSESDLEGGPLRWAVGASYKIDFANFAKGSQPSWAENSSHGVEVDANIKANGISVTGGAVLMKIKSADPEFGFYLQPGLMIVPKKAEIAARFALITLSQSAGGMTFDRNQIEARAAFNYYWHGHTWKVASDVGFLKLTGDEPSEDGGDFQLRVMMQLSI